MKSRGIHSQKFVEKRRRARQTLLFLGVLCLLTVTASGILLLRVSFFQIQQVSVEGSTIASPEAISAAALSSLSGNFLEIIPRSNTFIYPKKSLQDAIGEQFKEIRDVKANRVGFSSIRLSIIERGVSAVVCSGFRGDEESGDCYLSDDTGYIFAHPTTTSAFASLTHYYIHPEAGTTTVGANFVSERRFNELQRFVSGAAMGGLLPLGVLIGENGQYEMYVKNKKEDTEVTIYFDDRSSFDKTLENLLAFWNNAEKGLQATSTPAFDYINLRFGNAVYYSVQ